TVQRKSRQGTLKRAVQRQAAAQHPVPTAVHPEHLLPLIANHPHCGDNARRAAGVQVLDRACPRKTTGREDGLEVLAAHLAPAASATSPLPSNAPIVVRARTSARIQRSARWLNVVSSERMPRGDCATPPGAVSSVPSARLTLPDQSPRASCRSVPCPFTCTA